MDSLASMARLTSTLFVLFPYNRTSTTRPGPSDPDQVSGCCNHRTRVSFAGVVPQSATFALLHPIFSSLSVFTPSIIRSKLCRDSSQIEGHPTVEKSFPHLSSSLLFRRVSRSRLGLIGTLPRPPSRSSSSSELQRCVPASPRAVCCPRRRINQEEDPGGGSDMGGDG
ncbi:hypothetical protein BDP67DRAFT_250063 [Colletotrichum lupini]|nr:hypothetical protein BDP67DRAFT_250063 [Colletotrichum lupini]